jgi:hypothetical protein
VVSSVGAAVDDVPLQLRDGRAGIGVKSCVKWTVV